LRLRDYDYGLPGAYFVTVCTEARQCLFGDVRDGAFVPLPVACMLEVCWNATAQQFPTISLDAMVVMPNHVHGIVMLPAGPSVGNDPEHPSLSRVMQWFKSRTTHDYFAGVRKLGWPRFRGRLWQQGFHDHIVRSERALDRIREYIEANPSRWPHDDRNPER
jgi:REP element-mobilizing transposase RayT